HADRNNGDHCERGRYCFQETLYAHLVPSSGRCYLQVKNGSGGMIHGTYIEHAMRMNSFPEFGMCDPKRRCSSLGAGFAAGVLEKSLRRARVLFRVLRQEDN